MAVRAPNDIAPGLLIAMPQLRDPNFKRAVVLMLEHNEEGSFGVVINNPLSAAVTIQTGEGDPIPVVRNVYLGGPVSPHLCMMIHGSGWRSDRTQEIVPGLCVTEPSAAVPQLLQQEDVHYRFVMGYAGWGPGQLPEEMARGAWLCSPVSSGLVLDVEPAEQWAAVIRNLGIDPMMLVPSSMTQ
jgi:putative transcriptional regulator